MPFLSLLLLTASLTPAEGHEKINPIYRELRQPGLAINARERSPLPAPLMADGLTAAEQRQVLTKLVGEEELIGEFTRDSVVAQHIWKIRDAASNDPAGKVYGIDFYFVAHADLDTIFEPEFRDKILAESQQQRKVTVLSPDDLARRKIAVPADASRTEQFNHVVSEILDKVLLSTTNHIIMTRTDDSVLIASRLDPRFNGDKAFPNQWQMFQRDNQGNVKAGPPKPYVGSGSYLKITRLTQPQGALFIESHALLAEPNAWFDGRPLLRSKIPTGIQSEVRSFRRELKKLQP